jgi:hypothetical protein
VDQKLILPFGVNDCLLLLIVDGDERQIRIWVSWELYNYIMCNNGVTTKLMWIVSRYNLAGSEKGILSPSEFIHVTSSNMCIEHSFTKWMGIWQFCE